ncbi:hypothetical protein ACFVR2_06650 [Gottfriedia sp. NPDC057991]|uniref:hypothetical protein n=1 Tax=Gottfriedia sp. NPDC057991 TaxID=3346298 RepID=UPI0036DAA035
MKKAIGAIYILVALFMFFLLPIVDNLCKAISNVSPIANHFLEYNGALIWVPIITLIIGISCIFGTQIMKWFKSFDISNNP